VNGKGNCVEMEAMGREGSCEKIYKCSWLRLSLLNFFIVLCAGDFCQMAQTHKDQYYLKKEQKSLKDSAINSIAL
jgi:hypothetical protein